METLARETLGMDHVRIGYPAGIGGISDTLHDPAAATAVGLLYWGANNCEGADRWKLEELKPGPIGTLKAGVSQLKRLLRRRW